MSDAHFNIRYGPWALIAGASEGIGSELAQQLGAAGINVALIARRQAALDGVAEGVAHRTGALTRTIAVDLSHDDAVGEIVDRTSDLDIGFLAYCAGADPNYKKFLDQPLADASAMVRRNCAVPIELCHHFAAPMVDRGRGAIVIVGSGAGLIGAPNMVAYAASKAFDMVMGEALWAELHPFGVDVLSLVLGATDTPALRRLLVKRGVLASERDVSPIPGAESVETVVTEALANLAHGPNYFVGDLLRGGAQHLGAMPRNDAARLMIELGGGLMGPDPQGEQ